MKVLTGDKWFYHPEHDAEVGWAEDSEVWRGEGWFDAPADFPQAIADEAFVDMSFKTKKEIEAIGRDAGIKLDCRKNKTKMLAELNEFLEG